jgi:hypothetical protein
MTRSRASALTAALLLAAVGPSCSLLHKSSKPVAAPPPPTPAPTQQAPAPAPKPSDQQVALPAPPQISPKSPDLQQQPPPAPSVTQFPPSPPRNPGRRKNKQTAHETPPASQEPAAQTPAAAQPPAQNPAQASEEAAAPPVPQLEQILTPEQQQAYSDEIDNNIGKAQKTVDTLQGRRLSREQKTYLARVRAFIDQAKEARKTDLFRAKNLAERASVLAEDLLRSVQ